jgi:hypothetical protein
MVSRSLEVMKMPSDSASFMATTSGSATKLEMDQLSQYDTFHGKGIGTTPGEEFILCIRASTGFHLVQFIGELQ